MASLMCGYMLSSPLEDFEIECGDSGRCGKDGFDRPSDKLYISTRRSPILLF